MFLSSSSPWLILSECSAGMARLASDFLNEEDEIDGQENVHSAAMANNNNNLTQG